MSVVFFKSECKEWQLIGLFCLVCKLYCWFNVAYMLMCHLHNLTRPKAAGSLRICFSLILEVVLSGIIEHGSTRNNDNNYILHFFILSLI